MNVGQGSGCVVVTGDQRRILHACFCGGVKLEVTGPVNAFSLRKPEAVQVTSGAEQVATFQKTKLSQRQYCTKCGGHLMTDHRPLKLIDVLAATLPTLTFKPGVHVNCAETVLRMHDGLPKLKDFPAEFDGSGEATAE